MLVVPLVMAGTVRASLPDDEPGPLELVAPMEVGTTWVYEVRDHGRPSGRHVKQITGQAAIAAEAFDAVTQASWYDDYPGVGATGNTVYLDRTNDAIEQHGVLSRGEHLAVDPPAPSYRLPLEEGESWDYEGVVGDAGLRFTAEVVEVGDTEVGGRTFTDCVHTVSTLAWKYAEDQPWTPDQTIEEWACPGWGAVRTVESDPANDVEITEELVEFHSEEVDWFATPPEPVEAAEAPGGTHGFDAGRSLAVEGELSETLAWSDVRSARFDFPPVGDDQVMVLAERDGEVSAMDLQTGQMRWRVRLAGPVVVTPAIAGDRVLVADARKNLWALALDDGRALWVRRFDDVVSASPAVAGDRVVVASDDRRVTAVDLADSSTLWEVTLSSTLPHAPAVEGDLVVVAERAGSVAAYSLDDGDEVWSHGLEGGTAAGPSVGEDRVVVGDDGGVIYALDAADGTLAWQHRTTYYPETPFAVGAGAVLSLGDGERVEAFDLESGEQQWSAEPGDVDVSPAIVGDEAVVVTADGELSTRDLETGEVGRSWQLPASTDRPDTTAHMPWGLVGGALVTSLDYGEDGLGSGLYAYAVDGSDRAAGVHFETSLRHAADGVGGPARLVGDTLVFAGFDQQVHAVAHDNTQSTLFAAEGIVPGVTPVGDDLVLVQKDAELRAHRLGESEPLWTYETVTGFPGQVPAVSDDGETVFVPRSQEGLAAVSLETGEELWNTPLTLAFGGGAPLPLPGGDVVYGGAALGRYDGATGKQRWSVFDGLAFGPVAYDDGLVFADLGRTLSPSGLGAWDAETGKEVWFHEHQNQELGIGPAAGDGVVVAGDSQGLVAAFDAASGEELWRLRLATGIGGQPWIHDGVAYVAEAGRKEDLFQRDYRISAHDARTGAFLGSLQPPGSMFTVVPSVWPSGDALLAPGTFTRAVVMIARPQRGGVS